MSSSPVFFAALALCLLVSFDATEAFVSATCQQARNPTLLAAKKRPLSASEQARREEDRRRQERIADVVIGKTSAVEGAKDYAIDPSATEQEYLRQASKVEQEIFRQTDQGMHLLKMLKVEEAIEAFDTVFRLKPNAYLWQAGIAKFYLGDLHGAAEIFSRSAAIYESKFFEPATEERIWRYVCELKIISIMSKKERTALQEGGSLGLPPLPEKDNTRELLQSEMRKVLKTARELFEATVANDEVNMVLARAKLRSIGGPFEQKPTIDRKMWKLNSWYYLGLHYDVIGDKEESRKCMKMALKLCPSSGNGSDIVHTLPMLHMSSRDWFDDADFDEEIDDSLDSVSQTKSPSASVGSPDPLFVETVRSGLNKMRYTDIKDVLRARGHRVAGSKEELADRLFRSVMEDAGFSI